MGLLNRWEGGWVGGWVGWYSSTTEFSFDIFLNENVKFVFLFHLNNIINPSCLIYRK